MILLLRIFEDNQMWSKMSRPRDSQVFLLWHLCLLLMPPPCRTPPKKIIMHKKVINIFTEQFSNCLECFFFSLLRFGYCFCVCQDETTQTKSLKELVRRLKGPSSQCIRDLNIYVQLACLSKNHERYLAFATGAVCKGGWWEVKTAEAVGGAVGAVVVFAYWLGLTPFSGEYWCYDLYTKAHMSTIYCRTCIQIQINKYINIYVYIYILYNFISDHM